MQVEDYMEVCVHKYTQTGVNTIPKNQPHNMFSNGIPTGKEKSYRFKREKMD